MRVLRKLYDISETPLDTAITHLLIGAIFFAMHSCEYLTTLTREGSKRTKIITVGNITFTKNGRPMPHSENDLHDADMVRIKFEYQKNDKWDVCVHMFSTDDHTLNPVAAWAATVRRVRAIPDTTDAAEVCLFQDLQGRTTKITANHVRTKLRAVVDLIGFSELGFYKHEIGLHSIRSGGAMAMFLSGTAVIIIMRIGRWSSEAFLEYIRDQVESFTLGVSQRMLQYETFFNLSTNDVTTTDTEQAEDTSTPQNENGPESVPFRVRFNSLALGSQTGRN